MSINDSKEDLILKIKRVFADRLYPGDDNIIKMPFCGLLGNGDMDDPLPLVGKRWQDIDLDFFERPDSKGKHHYNRSTDAMCFLTPDGFCYFAPAYMIANLLTDNTGYISWEKLKGSVPLFY